MIVDADGEEYLVFDTHTHMGERQNPHGLASHSGEFDDAELVKNMDAAGVDLVVAFPMANPTTDYRECNNLVLQFHDREPRRIAPFARIQPLLQAAAPETIEDYAARGVRGLKFHPFMDGGSNPVNDRDLMFPLMDVASECGLPVLIHSGESWNCSPALIGDLADNFPRGRFIMGHSGLLEGHQDAIVVARRTPNVWLDTTETSPPAVIRALVREVGAERVLYGSDHPFIPFGYEMGKVAKFAGLTADEKRRVLGLNLAEILELELVPRSPRPIPMSEW